MNCKPGDLAVIIKSITHPEHIGAALRSVA